MARSENVAATVRLSRITAGDGADERRREAGNARLSPARKCLGTVSCHLRALTVRNRRPDRRLLVLCGSRLRARVPGRARYVVPGSQAQVGGSLGADGPGAEG